MLETSEPLPWSTLVHQWKEASTALEDALSTYADICTLFSEKSQGETEPIGDLVSQIDSTLGPEDFHNVLANQLARSRATLAQTRNRLASTISRLPNEILSEIFMYTSDFRAIEYHAYIGYCVQVHYRRLYPLLGVCSVWRDVGLKSPKLWNLVPALRGQSFSVSNQPATLSLTRSGTLPLHLAFIIPHIYSFDGLITALENHTSRIKTINISSEWPDTIQTIMRPLLENNVASSLSELALRTSEFDNHRRLLGRPYYMFPPESSENSLLLDLIKSLTRFRLCGSTLHWSEITFSSRLVELQLQSIIVGHNHLLHDMMKAIGTAVNLQTLTLSNLTSFREDEPGTPPVVALPNLHSLTIEDLYFNTLSFVLHSITAPSHKPTLFLTGKTLLEVDSPQDPEPKEVEVIHLCRALSLVQVHILLLSANRSWWGNLQDIRSILLSMPFLQTLKLDGWTIDRRFCKAFGDPEPILEPGQSVTTDVFRAIPEWCLTHCRIQDEAGFKNLVRGHKIRTMYLDASLNDDERESGDGSEGESDSDWEPSPEGWEHLTGEEDIVEWLKERIPEFSGAFGDDISLGEFRSESWAI